MQVYRVAIRPNWRSTSSHTLNVCPSHDVREQATKAKHPHATTLLAVLEYRMMQFEMANGMPIVLSNYADTLKEHTGGDWQAFTLSIEEDEQVKTKFDYGDKNSSSWS
jgi:hypothetical protein